MSAPVKVALVTASSAGLGAAIVHALAPNYRVVVNYFSRAEKANDVISSATKIPSQYALPMGENSNSTPRFHAIKADASSRTSIEALVAETVSTMGRLDVVVSNAGWTRLTNFMDLEAQVNEDDWDRCFNANVKSHLWLLYAAKPHLAKSPGGGAFVTVASLAGVRPSGSSLPYSVTKAAEIHLTKGLAMICGKEVRCNSVSPGLMMTEWGERFPREKVEATRKKAALGKLATPEDVAEQVRALVMSRSITGQNIVVDGGIAI
jgi:NAD(P)-dependent dehydrogenase (short-subunit alcohol dehydrogenase family)